MTETYQGTELALESARKKRWMTVWIVISSVVFLANVGIFVFYCLQPYEWAGRTTLFAIQISNVAVYACLSFAFFALKYRRLKFYVKMLRNMQTGMKEIYTGEYIGVSLNKEVKEGVDFFVVLVMEFNANKAIYFERKILLDAEKEIPEFKEGQILHFVTQANMLVSYEILERPQNEPTMAQKRHQMAAKDKERLFDNVIIDAEALKNLKKKKKGIPPSAKSAQTEAATDESNTENTGKSEEE